MHSLVTNEIGRRNGRDGHFFFIDNGKSKRVWRPVFWVAATLLFGVANSPPAFLTASFPGLADETTWAQLKSVLFLICLIPLFAPLLQDLVSYLRLHKVEVGKSCIAALVIFGVLCVLIFPFDIHHGHVVFDRGIAKGYATMSGHPFNENSEYFYRRILLPAIAYYLHLGGTTFYPIFALVFTFILICCVVHYLRSQSGYSMMPGGNMSAGFLVLLSVCTCGFAINGIQWGGYPEQLAFILILLAAGVPMRTESRLACVALALLAHDGVIFPMLPIILFCFPKREKPPAIAILVLFYSVFVVSYRFNLSDALTKHDVLGAHSNWQEVLRYPGLVLVGIFSAFKFYWIIFFAVLVGLIRQRRYQLAVAIAAIMFSFVPMIFLAADVTRMTNFAFLGLLMCIVIFYQEHTSLTSIGQRLLPVVAVLTLLTPSYNIYLSFLNDSNPKGANRRRIFQEPGIYRLIADRLPLTLPAVKPESGK